MQKILRMAYENAELSAKEQKFMTFRLKCMLYDISKVILFIAFFTAIHKLDSFAYAFLIFFPIRQVSGGLHFKHYMSCLIFSFVYMYAAVVLLAPMKLALAAVIPILVVCAVIIYKIGPILAPTRPALSRQEFAEQRQKAFKIVCYEIVLTILFFDSDLASAGYWTIILHTMQLLIAFMMKNIKKGGEKNG